MVEAAEVLQRRLVAELIFILCGEGARGVRGHGGAGRALSAPLQPQGSHHTAEQPRPLVLCLCWALPSSAGLQGALCLFGCSRLAIPASCDTPLGAGRLPLQL